MSKSLNMILDNAISCELVYTPNHNTWIELKDKMITGTDVSAIYGLDKYHSEFSIYQRIVHGIKEEFAENAMANTGKKLEPYLMDYLKRYMQLDGQTTIIHNTENVLLNHRQFKYLGGTPDGFMFTEDGRKHIIELKSTSLFGLNYDNLKEKAVHQAGYYAALAGFDAVTLVMLKLPFGFDYEAFDKLDNIDFNYLNMFLESSIEVQTFELNDTVKEQIIAEIVLWYQSHIEANKAPEITDFKQAKSYFSSAIDNKQVVATDKAIEALELLKKYQRVSKKAESEIDTIKAYIITEMKDAAYLTDTDGKVLATNKNTKRGRSLLIK